MTYKVGQKTSLEAFHLTVFGGTGDLAFRKIYPALYHSFRDGKFKKPFSIFPVYRQEEEIIDFQEKVKSSIQRNHEESFNNKNFKAFFKYFHPVHTPENSPIGYKDLIDLLNADANFQNIFYYSTPSHAFGEISKALGESKLIFENSKVVIEKPLGDDLASSIKINASVLAAFQEHQIYRIDHYLGKETVQNLMVLRFANNLFERAWNSENISSIQITVAESLGVEKRAGYYDNTGALRDMVQNHLLQLLCLVAMEPPVTLDANDVRDEKLKVLKSLRFFDKEDVSKDTVKGQYTRGKIKGASVNSYLEDIHKYDSKTETFVAIKAFVDNWRWKNVPFYIRTGKRMPKRYSDIVINFKKVKHNIFHNKEEPLNNQLIIKLQPEERIELVQMTKIPGPGGYRYKPISLKLDFIDSFNERFPEAYERLILDVIRGNQTLFMRHDELTAAWEWTESIFTNWIKHKVPNKLYEAGSWGPGNEIMNESNNWFNDTSKI